MRVAVLSHLAVTDGENRSLLWFFFGRVRNDNAADVLFAFVQALDDDSIVKWSDIHEIGLPFGVDCTKRRREKLCCWVQREDGQCSRVMSCTG